MLNYYDLLGVPTFFATDHEIREAYLKQMKFFHPDVFSGSPEIAEFKSQQLNEAYGVLKDATRRKTMTNP